MSTRLNHTHISGHSGQVAVIVLLVMAVLLVMGLSIATRTTQEIELSGQEQESTRVFNVAETGVEQALSDLAKFEQAEQAGTFTESISDTPENIAGNVTITPQQGLTTRVEEGAAATISLVGYTDDDIEVRWATEDNCDDRASLVISYHYESSTGSNQVKYYAVKPSCYTPANGYGPDFISATVWNSQTYKHRYTVTFDPSEVPQLIRVRPLYANTDITVQNIDSQAFDIRSEAQNTVGSGSNITSAIQVTRTKPAAPSVLDYAVFSGGGSIQKQ